MKSGASLVVQCLEHLGVKRIFGIPGAKIDAVFDALLDSSIEVIVCRHEQNAAFMAAAEGRITGKPGVVLVTSGPGVSNLVTGLLTATTEGDPVIAIAANVSRKMINKETHQAADNVLLTKAACKFAKEIKAVENIPEVFADAFRISSKPRAGAAFISIPQDITLEKTDAEPIAGAPVHQGAAPEPSLLDAASMINKAKLPILFLGEEASRPENAAAINALLSNNKIASINTFQGAGAINDKNMDIYVGRVGLFKNEPGDQLLANADVVVCIGFNPVEYDPEIWNASKHLRIIHIDYHEAKIHDSYQPKIELVGDIAENLNLLSKALKIKLSPEAYKLIEDEKNHFHNSLKLKTQALENKVHPLEFIQALQSHLHSNARVMCDVGSNYMWFARHFVSKKPHHILFSNGQQTLGVAMPWALSLSTLNPEEEIVSISGDGGFLFSVMELETAVRLKAKFIHFVWTDGSYNMVLEQQLMKYHRKSAVDLGPIDIVKLAEGFGAQGFNLTSIDDFPMIWQKAKSVEGPVLVNVAIDYSDNPAMFKTVNENIGH